MTGLTGQIAVVTGASGGIGGAIASVFAQHGAALYLVGRDATGLRARADDLAACSPGAVAVRCDLSDDGQIEALGARIQDKHGRVDVLVHCAGIVEHGKLADTPVSSLDRLYSVNVRGPALLTQKLLPLLTRPRGQIVFINSSAGLAAQDANGYYSATKHALKALTDSLRAQVNQQDVRVLSVYPGRTNTARTQELHVQEGRPFEPELLLQPDDIASVVLSAVVLPWTAEVTDIHIRPMRKSY